MERRILERGGMDPIGMTRRARRVHDFYCNLLVGLVLLGSAGCADDPAPTPFGPGDSAVGDAGAIDAPAFDSARMDAAEDDAAALDAVGDRSVDVPPRLDSGAVLDSGDDSAFVDSALDADAQAMGPVRFAWPVDGEMNRTWVLRNYVDLNTAADSLADYMGRTGDQAKTYDGHRGVDISIATFREQDAGVVVLAAAAGEVTFIRDGFPDRNTSWDTGCGPMANAVYVRHRDGTVARYLHFRSGSVMVREGTQVEVGTPLGLIGSSGCSTWPHLHFELRDAEDRVIDPFRDGLFIAPPPYSSPARLMTHVLRPSAFSEIPEIRDPEPEPPTFDIGQEMGIGIVVANGVIGDEIEIALNREDGSSFTILGTTFAREYTRSVWWWNRVPDVPGRWTATASVNGTQDWLFDFVVAP